jgi:hypothetical protein
MTHYTDFYVEFFRTWHEADKRIDQEPDIHPGLAYGLIVLMEDEMLHQVLPDGSISRCDDHTCGCWTEQEG